MKNKDNKSHVLEQKYVMVRSNVLRFVHISRNRVEIGPHEIPYVCLGLGSSFGAASHIYLKQTYSAIIISNFYKKINKQGLKFLGML